MNNYEFLSRTKIIFGKDTHLTVGEEIKKFSAESGKDKPFKVLLHYGSGSIKKSGLYDQVVQSLEAAGVEFAELGGVKPNPRLDLVHKGVELCRESGVEMILAVGGGSVIDSAKAIAMGVCYDGDVWDIYRERIMVTKALPVATILTIPAAGSESSASSVITNWDTKRKLGYTNQVITPVFSITNPELCMTLPRNQMANGVSDMMSHIFERYFTHTRHADLTDALCEATLRTIMKNARILVRDYENYNAWAEIMQCGSFAHNGFLGVGRDQDWACHAMEHEISAIYDIPHGAGLSIMTPAWMRYVYKENFPMFMQFAVNVMGVSGTFRIPDELINVAIDRLENFYRELCLPVRLSEVGIDDTHLQHMSDMAAGSHTIGGLKKLTADDVLSVYRLALK